MDPYPFKVEKDGGSPFVFSQKNLRQLGILKGGFLHSPIRKTHRMNASVFGCMHRRKDVHPFAAAQCICCIAATDASATVSLEFSDGPRAYLPADTKEWKGLKNELHIFLPHPRLIRSSIRSKSSLPQTQANSWVSQRKKDCPCAGNPRVRCYSEHQTRLILSKV